MAHEFKQMKNRVLLKIWLTMCLVLCTLLSYAQLVRISSGVILPKRFLVSELRKTHLKMTADYTHPCASARSSDHEALNPRNGLWSYGRDSLLAQQIGKTLAETRSLISKLTCSTFLSIDGDTLGTAWCSIANIRSDSASVTVFDSSVDMVFVYSLSFADGQLDAFLINSDWRTTMRYDKYDKWCRISFDMFIRNENRGGSWNGRLLPLLPEGRIKTSEIYVNRIRRVVAKRLPD